jgi:hypothetical protein
MVRCCAYVVHTVVKGGSGVFEFFSFANRQVLGAGLFGQDVGILEFLVKFGCTGTNFLNSWTLLFLFAGFMI